MSSEALPVHARALLEHQEFVRSLAKSLLKDEHAAQDVAQETLLTLLTHPPRTLESMRGWLAQVTRNRARSVARREMRRVHRETIAAREEADESETKMHERLALQHQVVEAVLALREPYKSVVVLTYYEGLSPTEIAQRRDIPAGTVRAQLSRAHEMLRQKLDAEFGGERSAWSAALAAWATRSRAGASGAKLAAATLVTASIVAVGAAVWVWSGHGSAVENPRIADAPAIANANADPMPAPLVPPLELPNATGVAPSLPAGSQSREPAVANFSELDRMTIEGKQIQLILRKRLLTPDPALVDAHAELKRDPGVHFARLWQRGALGAERNNLVGLRGAGAYLSFATGKQDYDHEPDLGLDHGFLSGFYGGTVGVVVRIDAAGLNDVANVRSLRPSSIDGEAWTLLWQESKVDERSIPAEFERSLRAMTSGYPVGVADEAAYLVRHVSAGEHDVLAAFQVIGRDEKSATIAWRVIKQWEVPRATNRSTWPDLLAGVAASPPNLGALSTDELIDRRKAIDERAAHLILDVPDNIDPEWRRYAALKEGGLARIAEFGKWDSLLSIDGGGAYWSFTTRSNDYQKEAQVGLQQGRFKSGFAGRDQGFVLDLGEIALDDVARDGLSRELDPRGEEARALLCELAPVPLAKDRTELAISTEDCQHAWKLGMVLGAKAYVGHTYLVRSVITGSNDVLAAFQVLATDEGASTIAWKILRQRPASR